MSDRIVELEDDRPRRMIDLYDLQYPGDLSVDGSQMSFGVSATDLSLSCGTTVSFRFGKRLDLALCSRQWAWTSWPGHLGHVRLCVF